MLRKIRRRPQLALVGIGALVVLIAVIAVPVVPRVRGPFAAQAAVDHGGVQAAAAESATATATAGPTGHLLPASPNVTARWGDSTALVSWQPMAGASSYVVTLIRSKDLGIMERQTVPASQRMFDAQGVWPDEWYQVAVQPVGSDGSVGAPSYSAPGKANPLDRSKYDGFLDTGTLAAGQINNNLWDERGYNVGGLGAQAGAFVNNQLHFHIQTGTIAYEQALTGITARTPFDFTGRTGTIRGEVDLHGDFFVWFAAVLAPRMIAPTEFVDPNDRAKNHAVPFLELMNDDQGVHLFETVPSQGVLELGQPAQPDYTYLNVRNFVEWQVSTTHVRVTIDGQVAFDTDLPVALPFSVGYLNLVAENYPGNGGGVRARPACDDEGNECNVWHLDNWGFDAPAGQTAMPDVGVAYDTACTQPVLPAGLVQSPRCDLQDISGGHAFTVHVADDSPMKSAAVVFDLVSGQGPVQVSVNGGPAVAENPAWIGGDGTFIANGATIPIDPAQLHAGNNTIVVRAGAGSACNLAVEQVYQRPFTPPPLPPEPNPVGHWS